MGMMYGNGSFKGGIDAAVLAYIGDSTLTTSADNLGDAINEHEEDISEIKSNLTVLDDRKIYKVSTSNTLSGGYVTRDLGSDFGDSGTYYCIGASAYIANNAQVVVACAVQQGRYIRMGMHWNNSYTNSAVTLTYYYVKTSSLG